MKIAINLKITCNLEKALSAFITGCWKETATLKPDHEFIFIADQKLPGPTIKNVQTIHVKRTAIKWFDEIKLNRLIARLQPDIVVTASENGFCIRPFFKKTSKSSGNVYTQIVFDGFAMPEQTTAETTTTFIKPAFAGAISSLTWAETESIKTQYTGGRDFFLFTGDISGQHQLVELLQAFSVFKKWQQSNMQLIIAGHGTKWTNLFEEKLLTYKYRSDIVVLKNIATTEMAKLVAASYAVVYPVAENIFPLALIWAIQSGKAVITTDISSNKTITGAAVWVPAKETTEGFAKAMILLYKDENYRQQLIKQLTEKAEEFNREQMLAAIWEQAEQSQTKSA